MSFGVVSASGAGAAFEAVAVCGLVAAPDAGVFGAGVCDEVEDAGGAEVVCAASIVEKNTILVERKVNFIFECKFGM